MTLLDEAGWRARAHTHADRADALTAAHRDRRERHESHPVEDFLYTYYPTRPNRLRVWHPGAGVVLAHSDRAGWRHYTPDGSRIDVTTIRPATIAFVRSLLTATAARERQVALEQPGCLHATMDLYKWATKLGPLVPGELLLDCFELARDVRTLDMRASPYDLAAHGYTPVRIETAAGKAEYAAAQRGFAERGAVLRERLLDALPDP